MQFQVTHAEVQAEGFAETAAFTIAASGKAFKGLIDGLYSRKIEAAVRELATNALDAHIAAENPEPFYVHLPKPFAPTFYIRDYGTGMSHFLVMRRYATMFDSTKDGMNSDDAGVDPNNQVGMLGLGSKSFFAYTDSCTITIWQEGEARFYSVYMGADGIPQISFAGKQPSDEPVGVKVEFPVKTKDCKEFENAAIRVFKGFPYPPAGLSEDVLEEIAVEPTQVGSFWRAYPKDYLPNSGYWARQGCVLYPIDLGLIDTRSTETEQRYYDHTENEYRTRTVRVLSGDFAEFATLDATVVVDFPIGSLDFDLGRERLAYNDRTVASLRTRWDEMLADVSRAVEAQFQGVQTDWDYLKTGVGIDFKSLGKLYTMTKPYRRYADLVTDFTALFPKDRAERGPNKLVSATLAPTAHEGLDYYLTYDKSAIEWAGQFTTSLDKVVFVLIDASPSRINQRITHYLNQKGLDMAFIIRGKLKESKAALKKWGKVPMVLASKLPELPKIVREKRPKQEHAERMFHRIKLLDEYGNTIAPESTSDYEGHVFAFMNCGNIHNPDPSRYPDIPMHKFLAYHYMMKEFLGVTVSFINVKSNEYDKLDRYSEFPLFYDLIDEIGKEFSLKHLRMISNTWNVRQFQGTVYNNVLNTWGNQADGELAGLSRFGDRADAVPSKRGLKKAIQAVLDYDHLKEAAISQAIAAGLEVLPERAVHKSALPYPLLSRRWEKFVKALSLINTSYRQSTYKHMKRSFEC